jgi:hypothetical protein
MLLLLDAPPIALPIAPGKAMLEAVVVVYLGVDGGESCPRLSVGDEVARLTVTGDDLRRFGRDFCEIWPGLKSSVSKNVNSLVLC